jgi:hypothetical protein
MDVKQLCQKFIVAKKHLIPQNSNPLQIDIKNLEII